MLPNIFNAGAKRKILHFSAILIITAALAAALYQNIIPLNATLTITALAAATILYKRQMEKNITRKMEKKFQSHIQNLEDKLNQSEMIRLAEPHLMLIWQGKEDKPSQISGTIHEAPEIPKQAKQVLNFNAWIKKDDAQIIQHALTKLRYDGKPFNIGIETQNKTHLEADGRVAGSAAILKFRHIIGERKKDAQNAKEYRKIYKQKQILSDILNAAPMPIWLRDKKNGDIKWVNNAYIAAIDEKDQDTTLKKQTHLVQLPPQPKNNSNETKNAIINGTNTHLQIRQIEIEEGVAIFANDISKLQHAQKELERYINAYTNSFNQIKTAIAIFSAKQELQFHNDAYAQLWGFNHSWLQQNPSHSEILDRLREKRLLPEQADYQKWKIKQLTIYKSLEKNEEWWYLPNNSVIHATSLIHPKGGAMCLYDDVTEKITLESQYNALIGVQKETLDHLHDGVALFGSDGQLKLSNPSFIAFWNITTQNETIHMHNTPDSQNRNHEKIDPIHARNIIEQCKKQAPHQYEKWDNLKINLTNAETPQQLKYQFKCANGKIAEITTAPLPDGNILLTSNDATDRFEIERALREKAKALETADKIKADFLSNISYVLRTPLTTIIGFADILKQKIFGPINEKQTEYINDILKDANRVETIIDSILDITSLQSGMIELNLQSISVNTLMRDAVNAIRNEVKQKALTLKIYIPENIGAVVLDPERIKKVITNLITNAIGFSNHGETITIECKKKDNHILISVTDTGKGMEKTIKETAFDRFKSYPYAGGQKGVGLGLSLVKGFIELHQGQVFLDSDVNQGTTVTCKIPIAGPKRNQQKNQKGGNHAQVA